MESSLKGWHSRDQVDKDGGETAPTALDNACRDACLFNDKHQLQLDGGALNFDTVSVRVSTPLHSRI